MTDPFTVTVFLRRLYAASPALDILSTHQLTDELMIKSADISFVRSADLLMVRSAVVGI